MVPEAYIRYLRIRSQTQRQTQRQTDKQKHTQTFTEIDRKADRHSPRKQTSRHTKNYKHRQMHTKREDRQTETHTDMTFTEIDMPPQTFIQEKDIKTHEKFQTYKIHKKKNHKQYMIYQIATIVTEKCTTENGEKSNGRRT